MSEPTDHLTVQQAAEQLGRTPRYVRMLCENGELDGTKHGRQWQISSISVATYINGPLEGDRLSAEVDAVITDAVNPRVLLAQLEAAETENTLLRERLQDKQAEIDSLRGELHHQAAAITELVARNYAPKTSG